MAFADILTALALSMVFPIICGYGVGYLKLINSQGLTRFFTFILSPVFVFLFAVKLDMKIEYIWLPFVVLVINGLAAVTAYKIAQTRFHDKIPNLIGLSVGTSNTAHFGMPAVAFMIGAEWVSVFLLFVVGSIINMNTIAYYLALRGEYNFMQAFIRMLKLPIIYGLAAGFALDHLFDFSSIFSLYPALEYGIAWFEKFFFFIGLFIIGLALSEFRIDDMRGGWIGWALALKFSCLPLFVGLFILLDIYLFGLYSAPIYGLFILYAFLPVARNAAAYALMLDLYPNKAAAFMLLSILVSLITLPILALFLPL